MSTPNRDEFRSILSSLSRLLDDDNFHPGLMTWQDAYRHELAKLYDFLEVQPR